MMAIMIVIIFWLGIHPQPVLRTAEQVLNGIQCCSPTPQGKGDAETQRLIEKGITAALEQGH
jgi:hypothetical protein